MFWQSTHHSSFRGKSDLNEFLTNWEANSEDDGGVIVQVVLLEHAVEISYNILKLPDSKCGYQILCHFVKKYFIVMQPNNFLYLWDLITSLLLQRYQFETVDVGSTILKTCVSPCKMNWFLSYKICGIELFRYEKYMINLNFMTRLKELF